MRPRRVLFITYNFPPHGGAGVQRSLKFVKYLPQFNWDPWIVTSSVDSSPILDHSLEAEIPPNIQIERVPGFSINRLIAKANRFHLTRFAVLINLFLQIPDAAYFWSINTRPIIENLIKRANPDVVYTSSGPYSTHLIGYWVKQQFGIPWLADFRDPWSNNLLIPYLPLYRAYNRRLERQVLNFADRVVCVSKPWLNELLANSNRSADNFITITNGYDEQDIAPLPFQPPKPPFTITHIGSFYRNRKPAEFIQALTRLIENGSIPPEAIQVLFIGKNSDRDVPSTPYIKTIGYVPHKELEKYRSDTDVFLLILDTSPENVGNHSGKIFEYMASNRPILGIVPKNGVAQELLEKSKTGYSAHGDDNDIENLIKNIYISWKAGYQDWNPDWQYIERYTRKKLTARLAEGLNSLV